MSGEPATLAINRYSVEHAVHTLIALIIVTFSYYYIKHYIKTHHSAATVNADVSPSKSMFTIKSVVVAVVLALAVLLAVVFLPKYKHSFPTGVFLSSVFLILIEYNFARKNVIKSYFKLQVRKRLTKHFTFIKPYEGSKVGNAPLDKFQQEDSGDIHGIKIASRNFIQNAGLDNASRNNNSVAVFENRPQFQADSEDLINELPVTDTDVVQKDFTYDLNISFPTENITNHTLVSPSRDNSIIYPLDSASREDYTNSPVYSTPKEDITNSSVDSASKEDSTKSFVDSTSKKDFTNHLQVTASLEDSTNQPVAFSPKKDSNHNPQAPSGSQYSNQPSRTDSYRKYSNKMPEVDI